MADWLRDVFGVPVAWIEPTSHNTHENAVATARLLARDGISRVALMRSSSSVGRDDADLGWRVAATHRRRTWP